MYSLDFVRYFTDQYICISCLDIRWHALFRPVVIDKFWGVEYAGTVFLWIYPWGIVNSKWGNGPGNIQNRDLFKAPGNIYLDSPKDQGKNQGKGLFMSREVIEEIPYVAMWLYELDC